MNWNVGALKDRAFAALGSARGGSLIRGTALMGAAEMGNRVSRVLTGIALARCLSTVEFGMMALILTAYELVRIFIHNGLGARVVQAKDDELAEVCRAIDRINWTVGAVMFALQIAIAWPTQYFFGANIAWTLVALSAAHLIYPLGMTRFCVAQRAERHGFVAGMQFYQITGDKIGTAAMAFAGFGVWAAVVPKVVVAIGHVAITRWLVPGQRPAPVTAARLWEMVQFARYVLAAESLNTFRANADNLIVGKVLGLEAFGIYTFAFNNGSGIAAGLSSALGQAVLPYMSRGKSEAETARRFKASVAAMSLVIMPLIALQVALAPWYVPLIYGAKWIPAIHAVMLMSLGALSRPLIVATSQLLRVTGEVHLEWRMSQANAVLFIVAIIGGLPYGVDGVAACLAVVGFLPAILFARLALAHLGGEARGAHRSNFTEVRA